MASRPASMKETLDDLFFSIETDARFMEAAVTLRDNSLLYFGHRVGERRAKAVGADGNEDGSSKRILDAIRMFRLNARHLEILFDDGSCWEWRPESV